VLKYIVQAPNATPATCEGAGRRFNRRCLHRAFEGRVYLISPSVNTVTPRICFRRSGRQSRTQAESQHFARGELILERNVSTTIVPLDAVITLPVCSKVVRPESGVARARYVQIGRFLGPDRRCCPDLDLETRWRDRSDQAFRMAEGAHSIVDMETPVEHSSGPSAL